MRKSECNMDKNPQTKKPLVLEHALVLFHGKSNLSPNDFTLTQSRIVFSDTALSLSDLTSNFRSRGWDTAQWCSKYAPTLGRFNLFVKKKKRLAAAHVTGVKTLASSTVPAAPAATRKIASYEYNLLASVSVASIIAVHGF